MPKEKKAPLCARCKNHGIENNVKAHKRHCEFKMCQCSKCKLTKEHQNVVAAQVRAKRQLEQDKNNGKATTYIAEPVTTAPVIPPPSMPTFTPMATSTTTAGHYSPVPFDSLVQACRNQPQNIARTLLAYYGSPEEAGQRLLLITRRQKDNIASTANLSMAVQDAAQPRFMCGRQEATQLSAMTTMNYNRSHHDSLSFLTKLGI